MNKQTLPDDREILYDYDANGNLESLTPPGRPAHAFNYSPVNLESEYVPPQPSPPIPEPRTQFVYNEDRQLEDIVRPDGQTVDFEYGESDGRLQSVAVGSDVREYAYYSAAESSSGQLKTLTGPDADLSFTYDGSLLKNETWTIGAASHTVARTYNNNLQVSSVKVDSEPTVWFDYDNDGLLRFAGDLELLRDPANGQLAGTILDNIRDTYEYNEFGEVEHYHVKFHADPNDPNEVPDPNGVLLFAIDYERDKLGRITQKTETIEGVTTVYDYTYDDAGRLWVVKEGPDEMSLQETARYTYDDNGNRLTKVTPSESCTYTYDDQDRLLSATCGSTTTAYSYTANGELALKNEDGDSTTYTYDAFGNLRSVVLHDGETNEQVIEYLIDGRNHRVGKKVDGVPVQHFTYKDQLNPAAELDGSGNLSARYIFGSKPNAPDYIVRPGTPTTVYRVISDHLGSPRLTVDAVTGVVAQRVDRDEFGNVQEDSAAGFTPFGFVGGIADSHTGLVRFGARDYDPELGRWLAKDPMGFWGDGPNLYTYALADPINLTDPTGLFADAYTDGFYAEEIFFPTDGDAYGGAFRHCVSTCLLTVRYGETVAKAGRRAWDAMMENDQEPNSLRDQLGEDEGLRCGKEINKGRDKPEGREAARDACANKCLNTYPAPPHSYPMTPMR